MNLMQMKYFNAVCEFESVSAAAEQLHVAQPSVSVAIKDLELEFGTVLFIRGHKGMTLTSEGEAFLRMSREILERVEKTEKAMKELGQNKKTLRLGVPPMIGSLILPTIYGEFFTNNPDIHPEITECGREETCKKILAGELDLAFISHGRITDPGLAVRPVGCLELHCGVAIDHPLAKETEITPQRLAGIPLVMFKDGFFQSHEIKAWFAREGILPNVLIKTDQLSTMLKLISTNAAVGFLFRRLDREPGISSVPLTPSISVNVSLIRKKDAVVFNSMKRFLEFLRERELFS